MTLLAHDAGPMGFVVHSRQAVSLRSDLTQAERRATLLHELEHLRRGPAVVGYVERDEMATRDSASRWLLPLSLLADGLAWCKDEVELAEHLWVDLGTVRSRLANLTDAETCELNRLLDEAEIGFPK